MRFTIIVCRFVLRFAGMFSCGLRSRNYQISNNLNRKKKCQINHKNRN